MAGKTYQVFIAHSHAGHRQLYHELIKLLEGKRSFDFCDNSNPATRPVRGRDRELEAGTAARIKRSDVVLVFTAQPSGWIEWELETARKYGKTIIEVVPEGRKRKSLGVRSRADHVVAWDADAIVACIRGTSRSVSAPSGRRAVQQFAPSNAARGVGAEPGKVETPKQIVFSGDAGQRRGGFWGRLFTFTRRAPADPKKGTVA